MAINTSNNKVRIISTTVSGLTTNSKFSDIKSPALVVNTSEGGIFYADGSGGTSLKQLAALPNHTHSGYATTAQLANYLLKTGGQLATTSPTILSLNNTNSTNNEVGLRLDMNSSSKGWVGYSTNIGTYLYTYTGPHKLGIKDDGTGFIDGNTIIHSGNIGTQSVASAAKGESLAGGHGVSNAANNSITYLAGGFTNNTTPTANQVYLGTSSNWDVISSPVHDGTDAVQNIMSLRLGWNKSYWHEIATGPNANNRLYHRSINANKPRSWALFLDSLNYTNYCASVGHTHSDYLPKSGGTLTGTGTILGINRTDGNPIIGFNNNGNRLGWLGFNTSYEPIAQVLENDNFVIRKILHSGNYSNLLAGGTINGSLTATSFIGNLTGNADTATAATKLSLRFLGSGASCNIKDNIIFGVHSSSDAPTTTQYAIQSFAYSNDWGAQLAFSVTDNNVYARRWRNYGGVFDTSWIKFITSDNYTMYCAPTSHTHNYAGASTAGGSATKVVCSAATSDTNRPIVVTNKENTLYYTTKATLNYSTGNITAPTFTGNLVGNADSATKATNDSSGTAFIGNYFRKVTVSDNAANDFNSFENMTLTGRGDPKASCPALVNAPASWSGSGPAGGYGVLTYLWSSYGTQMAWGYGSNRIYIRNKYYTNNAATWSSTWDSLALSSDIPTKVSQLTNDAGYTTATGHTHDDYYSASASRTKNTVLAAPNGAAGKAVFRALVAADFPTVPVSKGGTGATSLTSGEALIGNGTSAVTTRSIKNMTTKGPISDFGTALMTTNTLAFWNGAHNASNSSNLTYCNHGAFGTIVTKNAGDYLSSQTWRPIKINNSEKLANSSSTALDISAGSNVTLTWNSTNNRVTIAATDTKYTHPASTSGTYDVDTSAKTASTLAHSGTFTVVTGALRDASGHISKVVTQQLTLPGDNNTDTKVTTSASTSKLFILGKTDASKATASAANYNASVYIDGGYLYSGGTKVLTSYTDTKNTTGADNTTSKIFLVGPTAQTSSNGTARTYSNSSCYASGGYLYSGGAKVLTSYTDTKDTAGSSNKKTKIFVVGAASQSTTGVTTYSDVSVYITDGKLYASNFITSSDERIKINIKEVKNSVDSLGLRFVEFDYKDSSNHSAGHIAQEVKEVLPEFVYEDTTDEEHMLSIDYTGLHSVQIKALLDRIIKLEEEIKILKSSK